MQHAITFIKSQLIDIYAQTEVQTFTYWILESVCGISKQSVLDKEDKQLSPAECGKIQEIVLELKKQKPIQYILGETEFYGLLFKVNENVLIPRPETEELVENILQSVSSKSRILDIGTGSGCIAIALAKHLFLSSIYGMDVSEGALEVAKENASNNQVDVQFVCHDIFQELPNDLPEKWDIIVSNPPYITPDEKKIMSANVLDYEPHQALFVPQDKPLLFYERIGDIGLQHLKDDGLLFFETSAIYGKETAMMLKQKGYSSVELLKDISGKDRMIKAKR